MKNLDDVERVTWALAIIVIVTLIGCCTAGAETVTKADLLRTIQHAQQLVRDQAAVEVAKAKSETTAALQDDATVKAKLADSTQQLAAVNAQIKQLQSYADTEHAGRVKAEQDRDYWHTKDSEAVGVIWHWRLAFAGLLAVVVGFFIARQYFPFLKLI